MSKTRLSVGEPGPHIGVKPLLVGELVHVERVAGWRWRRGSGCGRGFGAGAIGVVGVGAG